MTAHLTQHEVSDWLAGVTPTDDLLRLDDHIASCAECRALISVGSAEAIRALQWEFRSPHLSEAQLDDYASWRPLPSEAMQHLDVCGECAEAAADLRRFADALKPEPVAHPKGDSKVVPIRRATPVWIKSAVAAVAVAALGVSAWMLMERQKSPAPEQPVVVASNIPEPYAEEVKAALDGGTLHLPASLSELRSGPVQLRSPGARNAKTSALRMLSPLATAVSDERPVFRWTPIDGATYKVSVYDDQFRAVAASPVLKDAQWQPEKALARGGIYRWEVRATKGKSVERAPAATDPEAKFSVLSESEAARLQAAASALAADPLALGIIYAEAGAVDDAKRELTAASATADARARLSARKFLAQFQ